MRGFLKLAAIATASTVVGLVSAASAQTAVTSGGSYDGWKIFFPEFDGTQGITLQEDAATNTLHLVLNKTAVFSSNQGFLITFAQDKTVPAPATSITFSEETITNNTGTTWGGFDFVLATPFNGPAFEAGHAFVPPTGYDTVSAGAKLISYGGSQATGTTSLWNQPPTAGNDLVIDTDPLTGGSLQTFTFKEIPTTGSTVPVPAAAWTGLSGLIGLGLIANRKSLKRMFA